MEANEITSNGNKFAITASVFFAFVYFGIIDPHFDRDRSPEQHIDATLKQVSETEEILRIQLDRIHGRPDIFSSSRLFELHPNRSSGQNGQSRSYLEETSIRQQLVNLGVAHQALSKAKLEKKQYSIPLISVSLDEATILKFFPILVLIGLTRLLSYRHLLLRSAPAPEKIPIWAAPVPFASASLIFWRWISINLLGFVTSGTVIFLTLRFIYLYARENHAELRLGAIELLVVVAWAILYLSAILHSMLASSRNVSPARQSRVDEDLARRFE